MSDREQKNYNEVIGYTEDHGVPFAIIIDYTFDQGEWRGATGSVLTPVSQAELDEAQTDDAIQEWHEEIWRMDAAEHNGTTSSLEEWCEQIDVDEYIDNRYESYSKLEDDDITAALGYDWEENGMEKPVRWTMSSCGRIFPGALEGIVPTERGKALIEIIHAFEAVKA